MERGVGQRESGVGGQGPGLQAVEDEEGVGEAVASIPPGFQEDMEHGRAAVPMQGQDGWGLRETPRNPQIRQKQRGPHFHHIIPEARYPRGSELLLDHLYAVLSIKRGFPFVALRVSGAGFGRSGARGLKATGTLTGSPRPGGSR